MANSPQGLFGLVTAITVTALLIAVMEQSVVCLPIVLLAIIVGCAAAKIITRN